MKVEPIEVKMDGLTLRGKFYQAAENKKNLAVLFLHGWTGRPNVAAAKFLADADFASMVFSFSGHNDSDGKLEDVTRENSLNEAVAAYDCLKKLLTENMEIVVAGSSYGSYTATLLSAEREVAGLSLRVPANYPDQRFAESQLAQSPDSGNTSLAVWRKQMIGYSETKSLKAVHDFKGPIQIIEAQQDEVVPPQTVQNYVDAISAKNRLDYHYMEGWPHSLGEDPERNRQYQEILLNWLNSLYN